MQDKVEALRTARAELALAKQTYTSPLEAEVKRLEDEILAEVGALPTGVSHPVHGLKITIPVTYSVSKAEEAAASLPDSVRDAVMVPSLTFSRSGFNAASKAHDLSDWEACYLIEKPGKAKIEV